MDVADRCWRVVRVASLLLIRGCGIVGWFHGEVLAFGTLTLQYDSIL